LRSTRRSSVRRWRPLAGPGSSVRGGSQASVPEFLQQLHDQIHLGGTVGNATGRNIHQRSLDEAVRFCNAIAAITLDGASVDEAMRIYRGR